MKELIITAFLSAAIMASALFVGLSPDLGITAVPNDLELFTHPVVSP